MENLNISDMKLCDLDEIEAIYNTDFENTWKFSTLKSELSNPFSKCIIARLNNKVVGFAGIWFSVDDAHVTNIVVKKSHRNKGIGSLLLEKLINLTKENCKSCLTLEVNTNNIYAQRLYTKYNFKNLGIRKNYYNGLEDAFIMTLYL